MNGPRFFLAYFKLNTDLFMSGKPTAEELQYALVPEELPEGGQWHLDRVNLFGRPMGEFPALPEYLLTPPAARVRHGNRRTRFEPTP